MLFRNGRYRPAVSTLLYPPARFRPRKVTAFVEMFIAAERQKNSTALGHSKKPDASAAVSNAEGRFCEFLPGDATNESWFTSKFSLELTSEIAPKYPSRRPAV